MRVVALAVEAHPFDLHRQHVARADAALRRFEKGEPRPVVADVAERNGRSKRRTDRLGRSFRIPAAARQMSRKHVALEHAAFARQRHPGRVQRHHKRFELGHGALHHRRRFVALLQFEPVEAVGRQRDHVGQFADRREAGTAEHFQRDTVLEGGKIEFGRLRRSRQVGHAQDDFALVLAHIAQHRSVFRADERHGAAAEGERGFADRDQPLGG